MIIPLLDPEIVMDHFNLWLYIYIYSEYTFVTIYIVNIYIYLCFIISKFSHISLKDPNGVLAETLINLYKYSKII